MSDEELQGGPSQDEIKGENNDPNAPINVKVRSPLRGTMKQSLRISYL